MHNQPDLKHKRLFDLDWIYPRNSYQIYNQFPESKYSQLMFRRWWSKNLRLKPYLRIIITHFTILWPNFTCLVYCKL